MIIRVKGSSPKIIILPSSKYFGGITIEIENNKIISSLSTIFGKEDNTDFGKEGNTETAVFRASTNNLLGLTQDEAVNLIKTYLLCFGSD